MTTIIAEINTIGDLLSGVGATRFYKQDYPKVYVANTIGIRWQGDTNESLTNVMYGVERLYQVVYFSDKEVTCIQKADEIRKAFNNAIKTKVRGLDAYMTLGSFAFSAPFKTDTDGVVAIVGVLPVTVYAQRPQEKSEKMRVVDTGINGDRLVITKDSVIYTSNGGGK